VKAAAVNRMREKNSAVVCYKKHVFYLLDHVIDLQAAAGSIEDELANQVLAHMYG